MIFSGFGRRKTKPNKANLLHFIEFVLIRVDVPGDKTTTLILDVGHDPNGDWVQGVRINGNAVLQKNIGKKTCEDGWTTVNVDLSPYAGKSVKLALENRANNWASEAGYLPSIANDKLMRIA